MINELARNNFTKVVAWIKHFYPHAIEASHRRNIDCASKSHAQHTAKISLRNGNVFLYVMAMSTKNDVTYDSARQGWYDSSGKFEPTYMDDNALEDFLLEWEEQKPLIQKTLQPYENMHKFDPNF